MRKIAITTLKGGTGKTTTAVNLAAGLAARGLPTLLIDTDSQGQCAKALGVQPEAGLAELMAGQATPGEALFQARDGLYLLAGGPSMAGALREIARMDYGAEQALSKALAPYEGRAAYAILDNAPGWSPLLANVLFYAEELLAPVLLEGLAVAGLLDFYGRLQDIKEYRPGLELSYILPIAMDRRLSQSSEILQQLEAAFPDRLLEPIPLNVRLSEAATRGQTIWEYAPSSTGAEAYSRLTEAIVSRA